MRGLNWTRTRVVGYLMFILEIRSSGSTNNDVIKSLCIDLQSLVPLDCEEIICKSVCTSCTESC